MSTPWWRDHFDDSYFTLHDPLFPESESRREVGAMVELLGLPAGSRVLDVPCGWGRHTTLFGQAGLHAFGADLSLPLLRRTAGSGAGSAEGSAPGRPGAVPFAAADLRSLPFADDAFDAVVNVFTSLGLFLSDDEDLRALRDAVRVLRPGGVFLLESMHRDDVVAHYAERDGWRLPDGTEVRVRRRFDPVSGVSHEALRWRRGTEHGRKRHALRLRTATEIDRLLRAAGFEDPVYHGDWDLRPMTRDAPRLIAAARAPA